MASVSDIAKGFTISGLIDADARTRERFRISEIPIAEIEDHPANVAYSMDEAGIRDLAESIRRDGITDLPLVRCLAHGGYQMVSGHRRKAAYALLAEAPGVREPALQGGRRDDRRRRARAAAHRQLLHARAQRARARRGVAGPRVRGGEDAQGGPIAQERAHRGRQGGHHIRAHGQEGERQDRAEAGADRPPRRGEAGPGVASRGRRRQPRGRRHRTPRENGPGRSEAPLRSRREAEGSSRRCPRRR